MKLTLGAVALALVLPLSACSSDDGEADASSGPESGSPTSGDTSSGPAVKLVGANVSGEYCVNAKHAGDEWFWSGVRLRSADGAGISKVRADTSNVLMPGTWIVPGGDNNSGAFVPWSERQDFVDRLDWAERVKPQGATLEPGQQYTVVLRLRTQQPPAGLQHLEVVYESGDGSGSVVNGSVLEFQPHC